MQWLMLIIMLLFCALNTLIRACYVAWQLELRFVALLDFVVNFVAVLVAVV